MDTAKEDNPADILKVHQLHLLPHHHHHQLLKLQHLPLDTKSNKLLEVNKSKHTLRHKAELTTETNKALLLQHQKLPQLQLQLKHRPVDTKEDVYARLAPSKFSYFHSLPSTIRISKEVDYDFTTSFVIIILISSHKLFLRLFLNDYV